METECIFCQIINKKRSADIIFEDESFIVFKDINPKADVHFLLVPKLHIESINSLKEEQRELIGDLFLLVKKIANEQGVDDGYKLLFNVGRKGGQLVDHLHLHLLANR